MNDERVVWEIVTKFLLSTCRLRPQLTEPTVQAAVYCVATRALHDGTKVDFIPLTTGSVAELYIEPMIPHIGDIDVMVRHRIYLAIPAGHPPPTQLSAEFYSHNVQVFEIVDSHLPGYVYLDLRYLLSECVGDGRYNAVQCERQRWYLLSCTVDGVDADDIHGPAILCRQPGSLLSIDHVRCVRCLVWPSQAADWPTRHRNYGWPDSATVDRVVSNGCDVVPAVHRQCRQDEWMRDNQWRLSFSRAEIVLINSWMPVEQIVYHMLRVTSIDRAIDRQC